MEDKRFSIQRIIEISAYIACGLIAIALLFATIFRGNNKILKIFENIGQAIAYIITILVAGQFLKTKKHKAWLVCYVVFSVSIVVLYIVNIVC